MIDSIRALSSMLDTRDIFVSHFRLNTWEREREKKNRHNKRIKRNGKRARFRPGERSITEANVPRFCTAPSQSWNHPRHSRLVEYYLTRIRMPAPVLLDKARHRKEWPFEGHWNATLCTYPALFLLARPLRQLAPSLPRNRFARNYAIYPFVRTACKTFRKFRRRNWKRFWEEVLLASDERWRERWENQGLKTEIFWGLGVIPRDWNRNIVKFRYYTGICSRIIVIQPLFGKSILISI